MELFSIPGVGGIIEKKEDGKTYIIIQDRYKEDAVKERGLIEIPAGKIREFESIYDCLRREISEETGLRVLEIQGEKEAFTVQSKGYRVLNYTPFSSCQNIEGDYPIMVQVFLCTVEGDLLEATNESKNIRWISISQLEKLISENEGSFYPMHIGTLKKYLKEVHRN